MVESRRNVVLWGFESLSLHFYPEEMEKKEAIVGGTVL